MDSKKLRGIALTVFSALALLWIGLTMQRTDPDCKPSPDAVCAMLAPIIAVSSTVQLVVGMIGALVAGALGIKSPFDKKE